MDASMDFIIQATEKVYAHFHSPCMTSPFPGVSTIRSDSFFFRNGALMLRRLFLVTFVIEITIFIVLSSLYYHSALLYSSLSSERSVVYSSSLFGMVLEIFPHNLLVATIEFVPVVGPLLFGLSTAITSLTVASEGFFLYHTSGFIVLLSLIIVPHTWLELPSYAVACSTSIYLIYLLYRREMLRAKGMKVLFMYLFVVLELVVAAVFESSEILLSYNVLYVLLMWIPAVPILVLLIMLYRHINSDEYSPKRSASA
jgi:hypothetical protein